jgi:glycosyltransferase involved in cell wall biosynthesis
MLVSIGILAHNEERDIGNLISDVSKQTLLQRKSVLFQIHVVANGCSDGTVRVAEASLTAPAFSQANIKTFVHNLPRPGKSNAWNEFIHTFASPATDFVFLLDADIRIPETTTLQLVLDKLAESNTACVAVDESVKDLSETAPKTIAERIILAASGTGYNTRQTIAGALYCVKFSILKNIWMPIGLPGEDGFLRAMILTSNFTNHEDLGRIVFVEGARHIFESERTLSGVFRHNVRLAIGTAINVLLFNHIRQSEAIRNNAADYIRRRNETDPNWINELVREEIHRGKYFLLNKDFMLKRIRAFFSLPLTQRLRRWPILVLSVIFDTALLIRASQLMRKGAGAGYW